MTVRSTCYSAVLAITAIAASGCCVDPFACGGAKGCGDGGCGVQDACTQCDDVGCGACRGPGPIQALKEIIHGSGCGDFYCDEWISDPPYCCDPCDDHGHWVGDRCCPPRILSSWKTLWGRRGVGCTCGSCNACLKPSGFAHDGEIIEGEIIDGEFIDGEIIYEGPVTEEVPTPAETDRSMVRPRQAQPSREASSINGRRVRSHQVYYERGSAAR